MRRLAGARTQIEAQKQKVRKGITIATLPKLFLLSISVCTLILFVQLQELENLLAQERLHSLEVMTNGT